MFASLGRRLPRLGRVPRLCLAGACLLLALVSALGAKRPASSAPKASETVAVLVAARDLPAGHTLVAADVRVVRWPARLRPDNARGTPAAVVGRRLAGPVHAEEPITTTRLVGRELITGLAADQVATPVRLDDARAADVVHAGDHVEILETPRPAEFPDGTPAAHPAKVDIVARQALVLAVLPGTDEGAELVVATDRPTAVRISRDSPTQMFTVIVEPP